MGRLLVQRAVLLYFLTEQSPRCISSGNLFVGTLVNGFSFTISMVLPHERHLQFASTTTHLRSFLPTAVGDKDPILVPTADARDHGSGPAKPSTAGDAPPVSRAVSIVLTHGSGLEHLDRFLGTLWELEDVAGGPVNGQAILPSEHAVMTTRSATLASGSSR